MNKLEAEYEAHLKQLLHDGKVEWYSFEGMTFRLADMTRYTPDFAVMMSGGALEMHEVKGFWQQDARVKIKVAASLFPMKFIGITKRTKKLGGGWCVEEF